MVEFTDEEKEQYRKRLEERAARQAREAKQDKPPEYEKQPNKGVPFKSRIGRRIAGALDTATNKAEAYREKVDYVSDRTGRIKKAILPKPHAKPARPAARAIRSVARQGRRIRPPAPVYHAAPRSGPAFNDFIHGPPSQRSGSDQFNSLIGMGAGKKKGKGGDFFREFIG